MFFQVFIAVAGMIGLAACLVVLWKNPKPWPFLIFQACCVAPFVSATIVPPPTEGGMLMMMLASVVVPIVWWVVSVIAAARRLTR